MESLSYWLFSATISFFIFKFLKFRHGRKNLPPGPRPWPLIGNLNLIGPLPHQSLHKLSQSYGKLMHLSFGSTPVVVASSPDMARLFLKTLDHNFASRPGTAAGKYTTYNYRDILWAPYGVHWTQGRKVYLNEVFSPKKLGSSEYIRDQEMHILLSSLHELSGEPMKLKDHVLHMNLNVISRIVLGRKYFSESKNEKEIMRLEEFGETLEEFVVLNGAFNIGDWMPWLGFMDLQGYVKRMKALGKRFDWFNEHVLEEHRERMKVEGEGFVAKDFVDVLLKLAEHPKLEIKLNSDVVKALTQDLIIGGPDTMTMTVEWAMSELIKRPHLLKKATEELDRVIGKERWVQETDLKNLPFINCIIKETMRLHPPAVLLAPHLALEDCKVDGYDIAKNTVIFINAWSIGRDSDVWNDPERFQPERFLCNDIDVQGQHFELLPFGSGRRMCPGFKLALKMMKPLLGNMLHGFTWKLPHNMCSQELNMEESYGITTKMKHPLVVVAEPRLAGHMYK